MAQAVLNIVVSKLANVIQKEMEHLGGVGGKVQRVQRELIRIQCCLRDAASKRKGDARVQNWLNELRDVAYLIEDAIDTFLSLSLRDGVDDNLKEDSSFLPKFKKLRRMPRDMYHHHKLSTELDEIQNLLKEISESRVRYGIVDLQDIVGEAIRMPFRRATYSEVDETEVVGMQAHNNNILKLLRPEKTPRRAVITIVGSGGLGKTTLACMVYKSAKADFDYNIMLSISQQFSLTDLLRNMISKCNDSVPNDRDVDYYVGYLRSFLSTKRYLIILDDVWTGDLWNELKEVLPDNKNGSRVLITSRSIEVAKSADSKMVPYELTLLDDRESLDLLLKKAFPYQEPGEECPNDLLELAPKISKKCKGLPLALIVLGGILATKELSYPVWERVLQTMNWHSDGRDCMEVLAMSYEDMSYYLKACFQYLAIFPEDYVFSAKRLIRMWVAEGFIPLEGRPTIEIMAEECLEELSKRSMVQVSSRHTNGLIKSFQVHDLLRDLAIREAEQEKFVTVFSQASDVKKKPNRRIRRASFQGLESGLQFKEYVGSQTNTRSLLLIRVKLLSTSFECSNFRLLKVVELEPFHDDYSIPSYDFKSLEDLIHLKYLGLRGVDCQGSYLSLNHMRCLQTLDVRRSLIRLCKNLWTIDTLRHVLCSYGLKNLMIGPESTVDLNNLQTMQWITPPIITWARKFPLLKNLCKLGVCNVNIWIPVSNLLETLPSLVSLGIRATSGQRLPVEIIYPIALPNYHKLQSLYLHGVWHENVTLEARLFPPHLVKLTLERSKLEQNPMPELGKLKSLKKLCLRFNIFSESYSGPTICPAGFPVLQYLIVTESNIKYLMVEKGVMPKLTYLKVTGFYSKTKVQLPPELQHVTVVE